MVYDWNLNDIELNALPVYDDRYIKTKIIYGHKVYINFGGGLNVSEDDTKCDSFTVISIGSLLAYKNKYTCKCIQRIVRIKLQTSKWQIIFVKISLRLDNINAIELI